MTQKKQRSSEKSGEIQVSSLNTICEI